MDIIDLAFTCLFVGEDNSFTDTPSTICLRKVSRDSVTTCPQTNSDEVEPSQSSFYSKKRCQNCKITLDNYHAWYCANDHFYCSEECRR